MRQHQPRLFDHISRFPHGFCSRQNALLSACDTREEIPAAPDWRIPQQYYIISDNKAITHAEHRLYTSSAA